MSNTIVGIDLGTTMSAIAHVDVKKLGTPEIISNKGTGDRLTPSVISFLNDPIEVGLIAKNNEVAAKEKLLANFFKRNMEDDSYRFEAKGVSYSAAQLSAIILSHLKKFASKEIGEISDAVISIPARFGEKAREATIEAGKQAGLNVLGIINEPTAAGIYYSNAKNIDGTVLVYDLGGGTFDVTIMKIKGDTIKEIGSGGDANLGGIDFDKIMLYIMREKYLEESGNVLYDEADIEEEYAKLLIAEELKKTLSTTNCVEKRLVGTEGRVRITISKSEFEEEIKDKIAQTEIIIYNLLEEEGIELKTKDIDTILLVGGSTRMPIVAESIKRMFNKEPDASVNVDTAVALGAALQAAVIKSKKNPESVPIGIKDIEISKVANHSYGTLCIDVTNDKQVNSIIIKKNTEIPCTEVGYFLTIKDGQTTLVNKVTQGESRNADEVKIIDKIVLNLPGGRPKGQNIETTYSYDDNQIMHCVVKDVVTGKTTGKSVDLS